MSTQQSSEDRQPKSKLNLSVVVASLGRPNELADLSRQLMAQTRPPDRVVFVVVSESDLPPRDQLYPGSDVIFSAKGLTRQRNAGMTEVLPDTDIVAFLDDDYLPTKWVLGNLEGFFAEHIDVVGVTGELIADGVKGPGITMEEAMRLIAPHENVPPTSMFSRRVVKNGLYGCNMAFRASAIGGERFDEQLPAYGWQEDIDFSNRVAQNGAQVQSNCMQGVHRGAKGGRTRGVRLGYSQVANPLYLVQKGTMRKRHAAELMARNLLANHAKALTPEAWIDRMGRVRGNWQAFADLVTGRMRPDRIDQL